MLVFSVFVRSCSFMCLLIRSPVWVNIQDIFCVYTASLSCAVLHAVAALRHFTVCVQRAHTHTHTLLRATLSPHRALHTHTHRVASVTADISRTDSRWNWRARCGIKLLSVFRLSWQRVLTRRHTKKWKYCVTSNNHNPSEQFHVYIFQQHFPVQLLH